jgi:hypothetical protein
MEINKLAAIHGAGGATSPGVNDGGRRYGPSRKLMPGKAREAADRAFARWRRFFS